MELNKIYQGDCLEVMKSMPDKSVDLVITSPPYNLGSHHTGNDWHNPYKDDLPEVEYQEQQLKVLNEITRILKPNGSCFYNHKNRIREGFSIVPYEWILKSDLKLKQELVWFNGSQNFDKIRFYPMTERVYWLSKEKDTGFFNAINHHDFFEWPAVGVDGKHNRAFPEELVKNIINCFKTAEVIFDPYIGSGTVAKVAKEMNRNYLGCEISPEYCKIAEERLKSVTKSMF